MDALPQLRKIRVSSEPVPQGQHRRQLVDDRTEFEGFLSGHQSPEVGRNNVFPAD